MPKRGSTTRGLLSFLCKLCLNYKGALTDQQNNLKRKKKKGNKINLAEINDYQ